MMNSRRKELIEQFKQMKPDMGIFWVHAKETNTCLLETAQNLKGKINSIRFQLNAGSHPNRKLQGEWKRLGADQFEIEILELLKYDENELKTDYTEELAILKLLWEEKLIEQQLDFY